MRAFSGQTLFLAVVAVVGCVWLGYLALGDRAVNGEDPAASRRATRLDQIPFDGETAFSFLKAMCEIGPRASGSDGMLKQRRLIVEHFEGLGAKVSLQEFRIRHPQHGQAVELANILVEFHSERKDRILFCAHYDTRPFPDRDRRRPRGRFVGANDGASGVAVLMELGRHLGELEGTRGVDIVLFDAEEFVFNDQDPYFLGSEYFAREYVRAGRTPRYVSAVLLDMIGDANLKIPQEQTSISWPDSRPLVGEIWNTAKRLGVREFLFQPSRVAVRDDHLALHDIGGIPSCDIIDFDYPHWHTEQDVPEKCSPLSLAKVGWVMLEWVKGAVR